MFKKKLVLNFIMVTKKTFIFPLLLIIILVGIAGFGSAAVTSIEVTDPDGGEFWSGVQEIKWDVTGDDGDTIDILWSTGGLWYYIDSDVAYNAGSYFWDTNGVGDGSSYYIKIKSTNPPVESDISNAAFTIDNTDPVAAISGESATWVKSDTIDISCSDTGGSNCVPTKLYYFDADGTCSTDKNDYINSTTESSITVSTSNHDYLCLWVEDNAGNSDTEVSTQLMVDSVAPTITSISPADGTYTNDDTPTISANIADALSGIVSYTMTVDGTSVTPNFDGEVLSYTPTTSLGEKSIPVVITITDDAGNSITSPTTFFIVDTTDPEISGFTSPVKDTVYTTNVPLTFTATDTNLDVCSYVINTNAPVTVACVSGTEFTGNIVDLVDGRNEIILTVNDAAGNTVNESSVSFVFNDDLILTVDDDAPVETPADFSTIQSAINAATAGDTINVVAGTYNENIVIGKSLTVRGANAGIVATETRGSESIIDAQLAGFGVFIIGTETIATLDGFTVENYEEAGILAGAFSPPEEDPFEVHILNNIVNAPSALIDAHNNNIQIGDGTTGTIIGNDVSGANLESEDWSGSGILVVGSSNVLISNNFAHDCEGGIAIAGYAYNLRPSANNNLIKDNLVKDCEAGISVQGNSIGTIISDNDVLNNNVGIESMAYDLSWWGGELSTPSVTEIYHNNIIGNVDYGVQSIVEGSYTGNGLAEEVDAENNYWGAPSGPSGEGNGVGDAVSTNVDYDPWYINAGMTTLSSSVDLGNVHIDDDYNANSCDAAGYVWNLNCFDTIQEGINTVAESGTVNVAAGTYNENLVVDKSLTINGANAGVNAVTGTRSYESIIDGLTTTAVSISASDVVLDGFTITIANKADSKQAGVIIANNDAGINNVAVKNNIIKDIFDGVDSDDTNTYGILVWGTTNGPSNINIQNNVIQNVEEYGIAINDKSSDVTIDGNSITNMVASHPSAAAHLGVAIGIGGSEPGPSTVAITNNILNTGLTGDGSATDAGVGIGMAHAPTGVTITNNEITGNSEGIAVQSTTMPTVHENKIMGNSVYGIHNYESGTLTVDATNNWWGYVTGPYSSSSNTDSNTDGEGNAVSDNVDFTPWSINEQHDTDLIDPSINSVALNESIVQGGVTIHVTVDVSDANGIVAVKADGTDCANAGGNIWECDITAESAEASHVVEVWARDSAGNEETDRSQSYVVDNNIPTISITITDVDEMYKNGDTVNLLATTTPLESGLTVTADFHTVDDQWTEGSESVTDNNDGTYTISYTINAENTIEGPHYVKVKAKDEAGNEGTKQKSLTLDNTAPEVNIGGPYTGNEGSSISFSGSATDGGSGVDTTTYEWDLDNDGEYDDATSSTTSYTWNDNYNGNVGLRVKDNVGNTGYATTTVTVSNVNPTASATNDGPVKEGSLVTVTASQTDPGADTFTYSFDWNNDGIYEIIDQVSPSAQNTWNDNCVYTVGIMVKDDDGGEGLTTTDVIVNNVAPVVNAGTDQAVDEGDTITINPTFTDVGSDDTHTATVNWGDSNTDDLGTVTSPITTTHTYADNGVYTMTVTVTDDDSEVGTDTLTVTVSNVAPVITSASANATTVVTGENILFTATATDAGSDDPLSYSWAFGDGQTSIEQNPTHTYTDNGFYTAILTVTDDDGGSVISNNIEITVHDLIWDLASDWNLVASPKITAQNMDGLVGNIWGYNNGWVENPTEIDAGMGYWVSNNENFGLDYISDCTFPQCLPSGKINIDALNNKWNLIGLTTTEIKSVGDAFGSSIYGDTHLPVYEVIKYNETVINPDGSIGVFEILNTNSPMTPGEGYWAYINK